MMAAIEAGAEDVESISEGHTIWCADLDLNDVASSLETELGEVLLNLFGSRQQLLNLSNSMQKLMKLVDSLEDDDDVQG